MTSNTAKIGDGKLRIFLVVVDKSDEMNVALRFAARRAKNTGGKVALLHVAEAVDFQHWLGVGEIMREERREEAETLINNLSAKVSEWSGMMPVIYMREGDRAEEMAKLLDEESSISIVVLAANAAGDSAGPVISYMVGKGLANIHTPFTIVPGNLSITEIDALAG
jgi:nucleotide-binding universal stress UspA family protein